MFQQYLNEDRAAQHQQQCEREAATERSLHASRQAQQEDVEPTEVPAGSFLVTWLRNMRRQLARGLARKRVVKTR